MALSRKHKAYLCSLALGLTALVVDRVFLGSAAGPQEAPAGDISPAGARGQVSAEGAAGTGPSPVQAQQNSLAGRLKAFAAARSPQTPRSRDVFALPKPWREAMKPIQPEVAPQPPKEQLTTKYRLMAVMVNGSGGQAIIDGKCLQVGQQQDGLKLISVAQDSAVVEVAGQRFRLRLEASAPSPSPSTQPSPEQ